MFVVFDMDGTLSNPKHRLHYLDKKDWDSFYDKCSGDTEILPIVETLRAHQLAGHRVEIWTGRRETCRLDTEVWLDNLNIVIPEIRMRSNNDFRYDTMVKGEWLIEFGKPDLIYEDRNSMVELYRNNNIICAQVASGNF